MGRIVIKDKNYVAEEYGYFVFTFKDGHGRDCVGIEINDDCIITSVYEGNYFIKNIGVKGGKFRSETGLGSDEIDHLSLILEDYFNEYVDNNLKK